ncbi:DsbA family protein [Streptomyces aidingensis]|uniref:Protein-disulfide isomerase n=1 Tax=Streptomyces aidingensis TaxID=910347 RepID=A0A1I1MFB2_9ACTN|nr:thioredoxin domain-containing protein [Streptomyces aidingensis]SFC83846.1 Protein-disulfide isomerase [Streptomyces aidingensis]
MSEKNRAGKRAARERLAAERAREQAAEKRLRLAKVLGSAVAVLAVVGVAGYFAANAGDSRASDGEAADPVTQGPADAPAVLTVYEDFRCPACGQFETNFSDTVHALQEEGKLRAEYYLVTIIDDNLGGDGSLNAANAALCAEDQGKFTEYHDVLFVNQPPEQDDAFADKDYLIQLAGEVEGLGGEAFQQCVRDGAHEAEVARMNAHFENSDYNATPTLLLNGENIYGDRSEPLTPDSLRRRVNDIAAS